MDTNAARIHCASASKQIASNMIIKTQCGTWLSCESLSSAVIADMRLVTGING